MEIIALLPMKGHSERVPGKNLKKLNGKTLFFYIADSLQNTGLFKNLAIDTDNEEIKSLAEERYKDWVIIIERPSHLLGDEASMNAILEYDIDYLEHDGTYFQTHSTNPMLKEETIVKACDLFKKQQVKKNSDSIFSVNVLKSRLYKFDLTPINHSPDFLARTQDLDKIYEENSNFYIFTKDSFKKSKHRIGNSPFVYEMENNSFENLDIDYMQDWNLCEELIRNGYFN